MRILVAEDEKELASIITRRLEDEDYAVDTVHNGIDAVSYLQETDYDAVILDVMMPGKNGFEVIDEYRKQGGMAPALFLTARDAVDDRVHGLDLGADDYLVKPFSFKELLARLRAITRRPGGNEKVNILSAGSLKLDLRSHKAMREGREIELSSKEIAILEFLMRNKGTILDRESIREHVWSWDYEGESNVVDVYIRFLRKKIDDGFSDKLIQTIRGSGYMISDGT